MSLRNTLNWSSKEVSVTHETLNSRHIKLIVTDSYRNVIILYYAVIIFFKLIIFVYLSIYILRDRYNINFRNNNTLS